MKFVSVYDQAHPSWGISLAAREISMQPYENLYVVRYSDGGFSRPANYNVAMFWCRKARIYFALKMIDSIIQLSATEMEKLAEDYACRPGRWRMLARQAINAARQF